MDIVCRSAVARVNATKVFEHLAKHRTYYILIFVKIYVNWAFTEDL